MLDNKPSVIYQIIKETVSKPNNRISVSYLCRLSNVSKSGYYRWLNAESYRIEKEIKDQEDFELIKQAYDFRGYAKGARSIHIRLLHLDNPVNMNIKKIIRLMHKYGLQCPIRKANPYRRMAKKIKTNNYVSNILDRKFNPSEPRKVLLTDITYIPVHKLDLFVYFATIIDAKTKEILAYNSSTNMGAELVVDCVNKLKLNHGNELSNDTLIHSDQGVHYTSIAYINAIKDINLIRSMSRRGNCWDNAPQESFFGHMKDEIGTKILDATSIDAVYDIINDWVNYYNNYRYIWSLNKMSPTEYFKYCSVQPLGVDTTQTIDSTNN